MREAVCPNSHCASFGLGSRFTLLQSPAAGQEARPDDLPSLVLLLSHHPEHFECHLSLVSWYLAQRKAQGKQLLWGSKQQLHTHLQPSHWFHLKDFIIYHVSSLENPEESKVLIGLVESSSLSGFWRHIQCLPPFLAELLQIRPLQFPDPCLLACWK